MICHTQVHIQDARITTARWRVFHRRIASLLLAASLLCGGCSTHLGYVPHDVYAPCFQPNIFSLGCRAEKKGESPSYPEVKEWSYEVADGYDSRATFNRHSLYGGGLIAVAATSALVGLATFAPGSAAIMGLPIGTTFLSGTMALYNNEQKAVIYGSASQTIRDLMTHLTRRLRVQARGSVR